MTSEVNVDAVPQGVEEDSQLEGDIDKQSEAAAHRHASRFEKNAAGAIPENGILDTKRHTKEYWSQSKVLFYVDNDALSDVVYASSLGGESEIATIFVDRNTLILHTRRGGVACQAELPLYQPLEARFNPVCFSLNLHLWVKTFRTLRHKVEWGQRLAFVYDPDIGSVALGVWKKDPITDPKSVIQKSQFPTIKAITNFPSLLSIAADGAVPVLTLRRALDFAIPFLNQSAAKEGRLRRDNKRKIAKNERVDKRSKASDKEQDQIEIAQGAIRYRGSQVVCRLSDPELHHLVANLHKSELSVFRRVLGRFKPGSALASVKDGRLHIDGLGLNASVKLVAPIRSLDDSYFSWEADVLLSLDRLELLGKVMVFEPIFLATTPKPKTIAAVTRDTIAHLLKVTWTNASDRTTVKIHAATRVGEGQTEIVSTSASFPRLDLQKLEDPSIEYTLRIDISDLRTALESVDTPTVEMGFCFHDVQCIIIQSAAGQVVTRAMLGSYQDPFT